MTDRHTTTVEAAAAWAREDAAPDRPTLGELAGDVWRDECCSRCGLRPTWEDESDPCEDCEAVADADCRYDEAAGW